MKIAVFCSARDVPERYRIPALTVVEAFSKAGHDLVWGGSDTGLMKAVADRAEANGARLFGVSVEFLRRFARASATSMEIPADLSARKARMMELADAFLILPGGTGTLDEAVSLLEHKKHGLNPKPIVFLDTDGFYQGLRAQLLRMSKDGFMAHDPGDLAMFVDTPERALVELGV